MKVNKNIYKIQPIRVGVKVSIGLSVALDVEKSKLELYKSLLLEQLELPQRPQIRFYVYYFPKVFPWPIQGYYEAAVCIRALNKEKQEGWRVLHMAVSSRSACKSGLWVGYPKYIPDDLILEETDNKWIGKIVNKNRSPFILEFIPKDIEVWWKEVYKRGDPFFLPSKIPSKINQMESYIKKEKLLQEKSGEITLTIDSDDSWTGLISESKIKAPGIYHRFEGKGFLTRKNKKPI